MAVTLVRLLLYDIGFTDPKILDEFEAKILEELKKMPASEAGEEPLEVTHSDSVEPTTSSSHCWPL
jgi:hypothetical protein